MKKRIFLALLTVTLAAGGAFAQMSVGFGVNFAASFDSYKYEAGRYYDEYEDELVYTEEMWESMQVVFGGFFVSFDTTFLEANIGLLFTDMGYSRFSISYLRLGLFGKYPVDFGNFSLFPTLGIQLDLCLGAKGDGKDIYSDSSEKADSMNRFWIKFGAGADLNLTDQLYLRPMFLYGLNFGTKNDRKWIKEEKNSSAVYHGLDVCAMVGYRF